MTKMYLGVQMNIKWLIQSTGIKMSNALILVEALQSLNVEYNDLAIFENKILNLDEILKDDYIYITKGGITFLKMIENLKNNNLNISTLNEHLSQSIIKKSNLYIDDTPAVKIGEIAAKCRRLQREQGLKMVIIDYLQLISGPSSSRE